MKRAGLLTAFVLTAVLAVAGPASATTRKVVLDGVTADLQSETHQVITVNHTSGDQARVTLWVWSPGNGWRDTMRTADGRIGYGGLVLGWKRVQGTGTTPLGTFGLISAFGTQPANPAWRLPYRKIAPGDFWVEDNSSAYYNRYRNQSEGGFHWSLPSGAVNSSERLSDYPVQYEYSIVTSFNVDQVRHRGAGIFLHVNGSGATAGCVSAPRWFLARALTALDPALHPEIAIGR